MKTTTTKLAAIALVCFIGFSFLRQEEKPMKHTSAIAASFVVVVFICILFLVCFLFDIKFLPGFNGSEKKFLFR
jgi:uncharacterized membrane protein YozB (DUF420 family)